MTRPKTLSVDATWEGGYRTTVTARQHRIVADEPVTAGGEDEGPQPSELFLASLSSCYAMALYHVAKKRDLDLGALSVRATGEYQGPRFVRVTLEVFSKLPRDVLDPLLERASAVCYVSNTLRAVSDVEVIVAGG